MNNFYPCQMFPKVEQRLWAQCEACWKIQGDAVRTGTHKLVFHKFFRKHHLAPALSFLLLDDDDVQEKIAEVLEPVTRFVEKAISR